MIYYLGGSKDGDPVTTPTGPGGEPEPIDPDVAPARIYHRPANGYERYDWSAERGGYVFAGIVDEPR